MTNNQLTTELLQELYSTAVSCEVAERAGAYMASFDLLCKADASGGIAHLVRKLIDELRADRAELQELRRSYLALRGENEDLQAQLYEAENRDAAELQERRKADSESVAEVLSNRPGNGTSIVDVALPVGTQLYRHAQPVPVVPPEQHWEELCRQHPDMSIGDAVIRAAWWNHCRAAMLQAGNCRENANSSTNNCREIPETSTNRSREHFISLCNEFWNWSEMDEVCAEDRGYQLRMKWDGKVFKHPVTQALWRIYQAATQEVK
ncbi:TPA: hypothetical protein MFC74_001277 [Klebsiella pneumoniae]|nr:hypothetical protein [Klebsiella pneumoniae]HBQ8845740.1 hypothetical protein [Klebsiella pneumoniae]HBQ8851198.1 hypothetical protein [Klebsiella pneumoniae]HBW7277517.1 hypothetical protein [Klebsiella pneumoniae]HBW7312001.1 hypothetical protein [Klebsiella pneumoniae]